MKEIMKMSKGLRAFKHIKSDIEFYGLGYLKLRYNTQDSKELFNEVEKELRTLEILRKYVYYSEKTHCFKMKEIRKSIHNFDYEELKEVIK